jgi:hypothetical protein
MVARTLELHKGDFKCDSMNQKRFLTDSFLLMLIPFDFKIPNWLKHRCIRSGSAFWGRFLTKMERASPAHDNAQ